MNTVKQCTCGEPHISKRITHRYDGMPCYVTGSMADPMAMFPTPPQDWEQKTRHEFYDTFTDDGFVCNDNPHDIADWWIDECKSLLQQERERMVKGLEGMKKWDEPDRSKSPMFTYKDVTRPYNRGFNDALSSAIALIENNPLPSRREDKG